MVSGRRVAGLIRSLVNDRDLHLEYARVLHETLDVLVLIYGSQGIELGCKDGQSKRFARY